MAPWATGDVVRPRCFPQRSDLVKAVVESGIDAVADAGPALSAAHKPAEALTQWINRFTELLATKRGLASALHSGDPAFAGLPGYFLQRLGPTLAALLDAAVADGTVRDDISAEDLLHAITQLSQPVPGRGPEHNQHIVAVLIDGLRCGATRLRLLTHQQRSGRGHPAHQLIRGEGVKGMLSLFAFRRPRVGCPWPSLGSDDGGGAKDLAGGDQSGQSAIGIQRTSSASSARGAPTRSAPRAR